MSQAAFEGRELGLLLSFVIPAKAGTHLVRYPPIPLVCLRAVWEMGPRFRGDDGSRLSIRLSG